jgi:hypothetical protein
MQSVIQNARMLLQRELDLLFASLGPASVALDALRFRAVASTGGASGVIGAVISTIVELKRKFDSSVNEKRDFLSRQLDELKRRACLIQNLVDKSELFLESGDYRVCCQLQSLILEIEEEIERQTRNEIVPIEPRVHNQFVPLFESLEFAIAHFPVAVERARSSERDLDRVVCSEGQKLHGCIWTAKIWPSGVDDDCRDYVSIFLELTKGSKQPIDCVFQMTVMNATDPSRHVVQESRRKFKDGDSWGWENAIRISRVIGGMGFLSEDHGLTVQLAVRPASYKVLYDIANASFETVKKHHEALQREREMASKSSP